MTGRSASTPLSASQRGSTKGVVASRAERWMASKAGMVVRLEMARVRSRRGTIELLVRVSHREQLGNCFIPFHFREAAANLLTIDEIDPYGKIPEFKFCAVQVEPPGVRA